MVKVNNPQIAQHDKKISSTNQNPIAAQFDNQVLDSRNHFVIKQLAGENLEKLCKALCYGNRFEYHCTVDQDWSRAARDAVLCDWGNGSYDWMLNELNHIQQQNDIHGRNIELAENYYRKIIHSPIFFERFKNWRFRRRLRVPNYIKALDPDARQVFWWLCDQDGIENMSQRLSRSENDIKVLVANIHRELHLRNRSDLLSPNKEISLENLDDESNEYFAQESDEATLQQKTKVKEAYQKLTWLEQFIVDAMIIDNLQAAAVLATFKSQSLSINDKVSSQELNIQHIYYFLRKTITKLKQLSSVENEE